MLLECERLTVATFVTTIVLGRTVSMAVTTDVTPLSSMLVTS